MSHPHRSATAKALNSSSKLWHAAPYCALINVKRRGYCSNLGKPALINLEKRNEIVEAHRAAGKRHSPRGFWAPDERLPTGIPDVSIGSGPAGQAKNLNDRTQSGRVGGAKTEPFHPGGRVQPVKRHSTFVCHRQVPLHWSRPTEKMDCRPCVTASASLAW